MRNDSSYITIIATIRNQARIKAGALPARAPPKKKKKRERVRERERGREREEDKRSKEETIRSIRGKTSAGAFVISF